MSFMSKWWRIAKLSDSRTIATFDEEWAELTQLLEDTSSVLKREEKNANGKFLSKSVQKEFDWLAELANRKHQWVITPCRWPAVN